MKSSVKRGLLLSLIAVMMIAVMGFFATVMPKTARAAEAVDLPSGTITESSASDGFYMVEGAGVKVDGSGIKFSAVVTKAFLTANPGDYIAVVSGANGAGAQAIKFANQPTFADSETDDATFTLNIYVNYDNYITANANDAEKLAQAYATELTANAYVKLADGSYVKAYCPAGNERSMRSVALRNYLNGESPDYDYTSLEKYFIEGELSHDVFGGAYLDDDTVRVDGLADGTYTAYVNSRNFGNVTVTDGVGKFETATDLFGDAAKEETYVLLFDTADHKAYTGKVVSYNDLIEVNQDNYTTALKNADYSNQWNHMVLTSDIAMTATWQAYDTTDNSIKYNLYGLFDGQGYKISNLSFRNANSGLFYGFMGEFKNTVFTGVKLDQGNTGTIAQYVHGNVVIDNVFVQVTANLAAGMQGGLIERNNDAAYSYNVDNIYVELPTTGKDNERYCGYVSGNGARSLTIGQNVIFVGGYGTYASANKISRDLYDTPIDVDIALDTIEISDFIKDAFNEVYNFYALNNSNFADLKDTTKVDGSEYFYLTEDITLNESEVWTNTLNLTGTFDGRNKTISNLVVGGYSTINSENKTVYTYSGLFKSLAGAKIFDVAFVNCQAGKNTGNSSSGLLAGSCSTTSYITNVFIDCNVNDAWSSGVVERGCHIVMTDCVVWTDSNSSSWYSRQGIVAGNSGSYAKAVNCYLISNQLKYFMSYQTYLEANTTEGVVNWEGVENALNYDKSSTFTIYAPDTANSLTAQQVFVNAVNATDSTVTGLSDQMMTWITAYMN